MHVLLTAGPTREPIDAVRYIGNRSSGRTGLAIAEAALARGHEVTLLLGPVCPAPPDGCEVHRFDSAADLEALLARHWPGREGAEPAAGADVLVMAAAVADYRAAAPHTGKLARGDAMTLALEPVPDLVAAAAARRQPHQRVVSFALEDPANLLERAWRKLQRKGVDASVANPLQTMDAPDIAARWLTADGRDEPLPPMDKATFAAALVERIEALLPGPTGSRRGR